MSPEAWTLTWLGDAPLPMALQPDPPPDVSKKSPSFWLRMVSEHLGLSILQSSRGTVVQMARNLSLQ